MVGIIVGTVGIASVLLGLAFLMRRRFLARKRYAMEFGNTPGRPFLDAELDDLGEGEERGAGVSGPSPVSRLLASWSRTFMTDLFSSIPFMLALE